MREPAAEPATLREAVRARYAAAASAVGQTTPAGAEDALPVLDRGCCATPDKGIVTANLYAIDEVAELPPTAVLASLGCGNPTALADLEPGETVLDLGSGGGIDVLLSARRVGPTGFAFGLDMTDEMLMLAQRHAREAGVTNVRFVKGEIEHIPLPESSVDVVISNCVINLSADKGQVLREAFRVLRPGGRLAVSDVVVQGRLPESIRRNLEHWVGCVAGALEEDTYRRLLAEAGFQQIGVEVTRVFDARDAATAELPAAMQATAGHLVSAFVRATKPGGAVTSKTAC
jgi:ubiquinone/menaquinone biosynthesis C-methylase UbiE